MTFQHAGDLATKIVAEHKQKREAMTIERHQITGREQWLALRRQDVTASTAGALLGCHDYTTAYALWAEKTGRIAVDEEMTEAMERGLELEPIALRRLAKQCPDWHVRNPHEYLRDPEVRLGATPDAYADCPERGFGIVQIKSVEPMTFRRKWRTEDGEVEPPLWIAVQAIVEAHLTGAKWASVAALVISYGIELHVVDIPLHAGLIDRVRSEAAKFWQIVENGEAPDPDYGRDGALLARLYGEDDGSDIDLTADNHLPTLIAERQKLSAEKTAADKRIKEINAEVLDKMGTATTARIQGGTVTAKTTHRKEYVAKATSFRAIRFKPDPEAMEAAE